MKREEIDTGTRDWLRRARTRYDERRTGRGSRRNALSQCALDDDHGITHVRIAAAALHIVTSVNCRHAVVGSLLVLDEDPALLDDSRGR